ARCGARQKAGRLAPGPCGRGKACDVTQCPDSAPSRRQNTAPRGNAEDRQSDAGRFCSCRAIVGRRGEVQRKRVPRKLIGAETENQSRRTQIERMRRISTGGQRRKRCVSAPLIKTFLSDPWCSVSSVRSVFSCLLPHSPPPD